MTQSRETVPCARIVTGTLYIELQVGSASSGKRLTVDTLGSTANTALRVLIPTPLTLICNDNFSTTVSQSRVITTIPRVTSSAIYRVTIGTVQGSPASPPAIIKLNVNIQ